MVFVGEGRPDQLENRTEILYGDGWNALTFTQAGRFGSGLAPAAQIRTIATYAEQRALTEILGIYLDLLAPIGHGLRRARVGFDSRPEHSTARWFRAHQPLARREPQGQCQFWCQLGIEKDRTSSKATECGKVRNNAISWTNP